MDMKITVVTICYNAEKVIENTIQSVLDQTYKNIEYLIIDGLSQDSTMRIVKRYAKLDSRIQYISEPDKGIYNAMNKSISIASGDYIIFMNAGDAFYSEIVLEKLSNLCAKKKFDIIYGRYVVDDGKKEKICKEKMNFLFLLRATTLCHQSVLFRTLIMKRRGYKEKYILCDDRDWIYWAYREGYKFKYTNTIVCNYDGTGLSSQISQRKLRDTEKEQILKEYFPKIANVRRCLVKIVKRWGFYENTE